MAATKLAFTTQPVGYTVHGVFTTQPVVTAQNSDGSTDTGFTGNITLTPSVVSSWFYDATEPLSTTHTVQAGTTASAVLVSPNISFPSPRPADFSAMPNRLIVTGSSVTYGVTGATAWNSGTTYAVNDKVLVGSTYYKCILSNTNQTPPNATYWAVTGTALQGTFAEIGSATGATQLNLNSALGAVPSAGDTVVVRFGDTFPTATIAAVAGVATFADLALSGWEPTALVASSSGLTSATSDAMTPTGTWYEGAELPRVEPSYDYATLVATYHASPTNTWAASTGAEFATALAGCVNGDIIELDATAEIIGLFTLRNLGADTHVLIRSSDMASLPTPGTRVSPDDMAAMPVVRYSHLPGTSGSAGDVNIAPWVWESGANGYTFAGLCIRENTDSTQNSRAPFNIGGRTDTSAVDQPYNNVLDRCYVFTADGYNSSKAVEVHAKQTVIRDSYLSCGAITQTEQQALWFLNGDGEMLVENTTLIATTENFMTGGAIPTRRLTCHDITFRNCHFYKRPAWNPSDPTYAGTDMAVKNLFEVKFGRRVLAEYCVFDGYWQPDQDSCMNVKATAGEFGIDNTMFLNLGTTDIVMRQNSFKNVASGPKFSGRVDSALGDLARFVMAYTRFSGVGDPTLTPSGSDVCAKMGGAQDVRYVHITAPTGPWGWLSLEGVNARARFIDSIVAHGTNGIKKSGTSVGNASITSGMPNGSVTGNLVQGGSAGSYPAGNTFVTSWDDVLVDGAALTTDYGRGDANVLAAYATAASDGTEPGVGAATHTLLDAMETAVTAGTPFDPGAATATQLLLSQQPSGAVSGVALTTQPSGTVADASDATVTDDTSTVTASWVSESGDASPSGTLSVAAVAGAWAFTDLALTWTVASAGHWHFTDGSLTAVDSATLTLTVEEAPPDDTPPDFGITPGAPAVYRMARGRSVFAGFRRMVRAVWRWLTLSASLA